MRKTILAIFCAFIIIAGAMIVTSQTFAPSSNSQSFTPAENRISSTVVQRSYSTGSIYGSQASTYWPQLSSGEACKEREDIVIQLSPAGCQPAVVRSDLLAEQNVPVFCQLDALKINPLIDIDQIRNIRFTGDYPPGVVGVGFHPARAALRSEDRLLGSPLLDNIGYIVVILEKNPNEDTIPDSIEFELQAQIEYEADDGFGIGRSEFILDEQANEEEWLTERNKQSFWQGRYFVRLEEANSERAIVSIYQGDRKVSSTTVEYRKRSPEIYLPGLYCQAGLEVEFAGFVSPDATARIRVDDDIFEVYEGSRFLDKCSVTKLDAVSDYEGSIEMICGSERFTLQLKQEEITTGTEVYLADAAGLINKEEIWTIQNITDEGFIITKDGQEKSARLFELAPVNKELKDKSGSGIDTNFNNAIENYEVLADDFTYEKDKLNQSFTFGEVGLAEAILLAEQNGKQATQARLIEKFLELYPGSELKWKFTQDLSAIYKKDTSLAGKTVNLDNKVTSISLLDFDIPESKQSATFDWGTKNTNLAIESGDSYEADGIGKITLSRVIDENSVDVSYVCANENLNPGSERLTIGGNNPVICGEVLTLRDVNEQQQAIIRLWPQTRGTETRTNFTVGIGIEKRNIQLNPDKAEEKIDNLNESIKRWESISDGMKDVVTGLKGACFATAGALTVKNFFGGLSGEGLARQKVMGGYWSNQCDLEVGQGNYPTPDACYLAHSDEIEQDVNDMHNALDSVNERIKAIEQNHKSSSGGGLADIFGETRIDTKGATNDLVNQELLPKHGDYVLENGETVDEFFSDANYNTGDYQYDQVRDLLLNIELNESSASPRVKEVAKHSISDTADIIESNKILSKRIKTEKEAQREGMPDPSLQTLEPLGAEGKQRIPLYLTVGSTENVANQNDKSALISTESEYVATVPIVGERVGDVEIDQGVAVLGLSKNPEGDVYDIDAVYQRDSAGNLQQVPVDLNEFRRQYLIGTIRESQSTSYNNKYLNPELRYYETEPYKGFPAIVPFDLQNGWYAATEQTLPVLGNKASFDASGRPASFWVCNVGEDGREQFFQNRGGDICQLININTGQPYNQFPGLTEPEARARINQAIQALQDATRQYGEGRNSARINGQDVPVGRPAANIPGTQCQDFMSPKDCAMIYNVCDPVICPSSRCDFGGNYPVADVIQTGIVGSALLCLPNSVAFGGDVYVPVCLTGIQAGIDGYVSILKAHQQCLQENLDTGQTVGICDAITSVYMCEFFWRQAAPLADVAVPKLFEIATGQANARGGGEYLTVQNAWANTQGSIDFFTQQYAVNSLEAFQARSTAEAGSQFCQAFISAKGPESFETLIEPDSPPQYHAWFDAIPFNDATIPATSQYKVFYHIFAGNDKGSYFNVYLKSPDQGSYYAVSPTAQVASGYVQRGDSVTDTVDFTAPQGYKELCVRVDGKEECGFKQVTTSFALDAIRDGFVSEEIENSNIKSQQECVSGSTNPSALLNVNPQSALEEAVNPEVYNRGVVRICASRNPGSSTDPTRFSDVGYCGDESVRCWLDKESVNNALSENVNINEGIKNKTLSEISQNDISNLIDSGEIYPEDYVSARIKEIKDLPVNEANLADRINLVNEVLRKTLFNYQKAELTLIKARMYKRIVENKISVTVGPIETPVKQPEAQPEPIDNVPEASYEWRKSVLGSPINNVDDYELFANGVRTYIYVRIAPSSEGTITSFQYFKDGVRHRLGNLNEDRTEVVFTIESYNDLGLSDDTVKALDYLKKHPEFVLPERDIEVNENETYVLVYGDHPIEGNTKGAYNMYNSDDEFVKIFIEDETSQVFIILDNGSSKNVGSASCVENFDGLCRKFSFEIVSDFDLDIPTSIISDLENLRDREVEVDITTGEVNFD